MPLDPDGQGDPAILVKALELPLPASITTEAVGVFQSDILIRSALIAGIADLRANPHLLDYAFASLPRDALTMADYGEQEVNAAKSWFLDTDIRVFININPNEVKFPCVSIALQGSVEDAADGTLSDTHYQPFEDRDLEWPVLYGPSTPFGYDPATGKMVVDPVTVNLITVEVGMKVVTRTGVEFTIIEVGDHDITIDSGAEAGDFVDFVIKAPRPAQVVELESAVFKETYGLGCHVDSEPNHLTYLHSILVFVLLRYRQALLEARGFERSTVSSTDLKREESDLPETIFSRYMTVSGAVRHVWPKAVSQKITTAVTILSASRAAR